jgi:hypothetical protein
MRSFLKSMGTVITLFPTEKKVNFSLPTHSDAEAIYNDWAQVGNDIWHTIEQQPHPTKMPKYKRKA